MALFHVPDKVDRLWNEWNLRGAVLFSLFLQILMILSAPLRRRTKNRVITSVIWLAYLLADWVAVLAIGLISSNAGQGGGHCVKLGVNKDLAVFWAPFLLLHLGGPDTITAFSLEDNELWLRHFIGLAFQLVAVAYVISQSVPNELWIPTVLMFFAGAIKYAERTRALFVACFGNLGHNHSIPKIVSRKEHLSDSDVIRDGYMFFKNFGRVIIDRESGSINNAHLSIFLLEGRSCEDAFRIMEVELNFLYDVMFTKMAVVQKKMGYIFRFICCVLTAVSFQQFVAFHHKVLSHRGRRGGGGIDVIDVGITLTLLIGAVGLELVSFLVLIFSEWTLVSLLLDKKNAITHQAKSIFFFMHKRLIPRSLINKRWCQYVSQFNFFSYSQAHRSSWLHKATDILGLGDLLDEMLHTTTQPVKSNLKKFISSELINKTMTGVEEGRKTFNEIFSAKGNWTLSHEYKSRLDGDDGDGHYRSIAMTVSEQVEYDESILVWHIATQLCYSRSVDDLSDKDDRNNREYCKILSDYMLYLLVMQPTLLGNVPQLRFRETCEHAKSYNLDHYFSRARHSIELKEELGEKELEETSPGGINSSVLPKAVKLAAHLLLLKDKKMRWEMMGKVWVELMCFGAGRCRGRTYAQQLSNGGELITFAWLLMAHLGLVEEFRVAFFDIGPS